MRSIGTHCKAGNVNLKGKKYKLLSCKCCVIQNLRGKERTKEAKKEIGEYK
jgi:hypothetical protein